MGRHISMGLCLFYLPVHVSFTHRLIVDHSRPRFNSELAVYFRALYALLPNLAVWMCRHMHVSYEAWWLHTRLGWDHASSDLGKPEGPHLCELSMVVLHTHNTIVQPLQSTSPPGVLTPLETGSH